MPKGINALNGKRRGWYGAGGIGFALASASVLCGCAAAVSPVAPRPVRLWRGGDDLLTSRCGAAIAAAFERSPLFRVSYAKEPETLVARILRNARWSEEAGRQQVSLEVEFTDNLDRHLGTISVRCWENDLQGCATEVVRHAERLAQGLSKQKEM